MSHRLEVVALRLHRQTLNAIDRTNLRVNLLEGRANCRPRSHTISRSRFIRRLIDLGLNEITRIHPTNKEDSPPCPSSTTRRRQTPTTPDTV